MEWLQKLFFVWMLSSAAEKTAAFPATGSLTTCTAPPVKTGEPATVTCDFNIDLTEEKRDFVVQHYNRTQDHEEILSCVWLYPDTPTCDTHAEYSFNRTTGRSVTLRIPAAQHRHEGTYLCLVLPSDLAYTVPCTFSIEDEDPSGVSDQTYTLSTVEDPSGVSDQTYTPSTGDNRVFTAGYEESKESDNEQTDNKAVWVPIVVVIVSLVVVVAAVLFLKQRHRWRKTFRTNEREKDRRTSVSSGNHTSDPQLTDYQQNNRFEEDSDVPEKQPLVQNETDHVITFDGEETVPNKATLEEDTSCAVKDPVSSLFLACQTNDVKQVKQLCSGGVDVNCTDIGGDTPLHEASKYGNAEVVTALIEAGAVVNVKGHEGITPLHCACICCPDTAQVRIERHVSNTNIDGIADRKEVTVKLSSEEASGGSGDDGISNYRKPQGDSSCLQGIAITNQTHDGFSETAAAHDDERGTISTPQNLVNGYEAVVKSLLQAGADIHGTDDKCCTPLHIASEYGNLAAIKLLLKEDANVNARNIYGQTPFHIACKEGRDTILLYFISVKSDYETRDKTNCTPLHTACAHGSVAAVEVLLKTKARVTVTNDRDRTPLHLACQKGTKEIVQMLLDAGAELEANDEMEMTPLHLACEGGNPEVVKMLLDAKANPNATDTDGMKPLHFACQKGHDAIVQMLLDAKAKPNAGNQKGMTPLHFACQQENERVVQLLLAADAKVGAKAKDGMTSLHFACQTKNKAVVKLLLDAKNIDVNIADREGITPLHVACQKGTCEIVQLLLASRAETEAKDKKDMRPLHFACRRGDNEIVRLLIASSANINSKDKEGMTPFHFACREGNSEIVQTLITLGADINAENKKGFTPLRVAAKRGHDHLATSNVIKKTRNEKNTHD